MFIQQIVKDIYTNVTWMRTQYMRLLDSCYRKLVVYETPVNFRYLHLFKHIHINCYYMKVHSSSLLNIEKYFCRIFVLFKLIISHIQHYCDPSYVIQDIFRLVTCPNLIAVHNLNLILSSSSEQIWFLLSTIVSYSRRTDEM